MGVVDSYVPVWEGETNRGEIKRIFAVIGKIQENIYRQLYDIDYSVLVDKNGFELYCKEQR